VLVSKTPKLSRRHRAFFKREGKRQDQALKALAPELGLPPAEAERYRPTYATPINLVPSEFEALSDFISQALGLKEDPRARKARKVRKPEPESESEPTCERGEGIADTSSDVTIFLTRAQRPKDSTTEKGADRRMRAAAVRELIALLRWPDKRIRERDAQRILHFLCWEGLRIVLADDPFKALRSFLALPGRGARGHPEHRNLNIAIAVQERIAADRDRKAKGERIGRAVVKRAIAEVAAATKMEETRIHDIYYAHRTAAKADLEIRRGV
jgi:hypothetical protein